MKVVVAGGSGFIGQAVVDRLVGEGHETFVLTRNGGKVRTGRPLQWDATSQGDWSAHVAGADAIVNLAGENIGEGRWTAERKRRLIDSRLHATRALAVALAQGPQRNRVLVNASAVGIYGSRGDELLTESSARGAGFLADLASRWEDEARAAEAVARVVILRLGVVIGEGGGALAKMLLPFRIGIGGRIGSGQQWMSWIAREDVAAIVLWAITGENARGIYNAVAPQPVRNVDFTKALGRAIHRPTLLPIPAFALRLLFGQMADETLLSGQRAVPAQLVAEGFRFVHDGVESALQRALPRG